MAARRATEGGLLSPLTASRQCLQERSSLFAAAMASMVEVEQSKESKAVQGLVDCHSKL